MIIDMHSHPFGPSGKRLKEEITFPISSRWELPSGCDETIKSWCGKYIQYMNVLGIEKTVYLPVPPQSNDFAAKAVNEYPDRFIGFAYAYVPEEEELERELNEMDRAVKDLGLKGFKMYPMYHGRTMSAPELRPIFEKANELRVPILFDCHIIVRGFVEMEGGRDPEWGTRYLKVPGLRRDAHNPARLVYSDMMDGLNNLKIILAHLGGGFFLFQNWPAIHNDRRDMAFGVNWGGMPRHRFEKFYYDLSYPFPLDTPYPPYPDGKAVFDDWLLKKLVETVGPNRVLFGTDTTFYPEVVVERTRREIQSIRSLDVEEETKEKIFWKNAARLLNLKI